jgi:hypothetical protein
MHPAVIPNPARTSPVRDDGEGSAFPGAASFAFAAKGADFPGFLAPASCRHSFPVKATNALRRGVILRRVRGRGRPKNLSNRPFAARLMRASPPLPMMRIPLFA